jgi:hypothetical protein
MKEQAQEVVSVDDILNGHSPQIRLIVQDLRRLVRQTAPSAIESAHAVWHSIHYNDPHNGYFLGIFPQEETVTLAFEFGILLPDPQKVLVGTGKQVRFVRIHENGAIPAVALQDLIEAALALPGSRKEKLAMIRSGARPLSENA